MLLRESSLQLGNVFAHMNDEWLAWRKGRNADARILAPTRMARPRGLYMSLRPAANG